MSLGLVFWILMLIWAVSGAVEIYRSASGAPWYAAPSLFPFLLLLMLGWKVFGAPVKG